MCQCLETTRETEFITDEDEDKLRAGWFETISCAECDKVISHNQIPDEEV